MTAQKFIDDVLRREGGYVNHASDRGGATNYGITQRAYSTWRNAHGIGYQDVRNLTKDEARAIYLENYWTPAKCDQLPDGVHGIHFDAAVNHGLQRAAKLLQEAARAEQDGIIGPATLAAAAIDPDLLKARYLAARYRFYGAIIKRDRSQLAFIVGWMARMEDFA